MCRARGLRPCPGPPGCSFGSDRVGHRRCPRHGCCCPFRQAFFGRCAGSRGGGPGRRSSQTTSDFLGNRRRSRRAWRRCSIGGFVCENFGDGMIRSVKLWPAFGVGSRSLRWPGTRRDRHGQEEIKRVGSQTASVLLARASFFGPTCLSTSVVWRMGQEGGCASKYAQAARLPAASRSYSGAGRKFKRGEISAAQSNLEELLGKPRRTEWHPSAGGEC